MNEPFSSLGLLATATAATALGSAYLLDRSIKKKAKTEKESKEKKIFYTDEKENYIPAFAEPRRHTGGPKRFDPSNVYTINSQLIGPLEDTVTGTDQHIPAPDFTSTIQNGRESTF